MAEVGPAFSAIAITSDALFGGAVSLKQPSKKTGGYRVNVDALLLAGFAARVLEHSAEKARASARHAVDLGSGVGGVGLSLLHFGAAKRVTMIEIDRELSDLATANAADNGWSDRVEVIQGSVSDKPKTKAFAGTADLVVCNPPYITPGRGRAPSSARVRTAKYGDLDVFITAARRFAGRRSRVCFVYPALESTTLLTKLRAIGLEPKRLRAVHGKDSDPARVVLVECAASAKPGGLVFEPAFIETHGRSRSPALTSLLTAAAKANDGEVNDGDVNDGNDGDDGDVKRRRSKTDFSKSENGPLRWVLMKRLVLSSLVATGIVVIVAACGEDGTPPPTAVATTDAANESSSSAPSSPTDDAANTNPGGGAFSFNIPVDTAPPAGTKVVVIWGVSSGSPDYSYSFGGGRVEGTTVYVTFTSNPPEEALNAGKVGVGNVALIEASANIPEGKLTGRFPSVLAVDAQHAIIFRNGTEQVLKRGWELTFPQGYACGRCVDNDAGTFDDWVPDDCKNIKLTPTDPNTKGCNWT